MKTKTFFAYVCVALLVLTSCSKSATPDMWKTEIEDQLRYSMSICMLGTVINEVPDISAVLKEVNTTAITERQKENYIIGTRPLYNLMEEKKGIVYNDVARFYYDSIIVNIPSFEKKEKVEDKTIWEAIEQNYNIRLTVRINKEGEWELSINEQDLTAFCVLVDKKEQKRIEDWAERNAEPLANLITEVVEDVDDIEDEDVLFLRINYPNLIPVVKNGLGEPTETPTSEVYSAFAYNHYLLSDPVLPKYVAEIYAKAKAHDYYNNHIDLASVYDFYGSLLQLQRDNKLEYLSKEIKYSDSFPVDITSIKVDTQLEKNICHVLNYYFYCALGNADINECEDLVEQYLDYID